MASLYIIIINNRLLSRLNLWDVECTQLVSIPFLNFIFFSNRVQPINPLESECLFISPQNKELKMMIHMWKHL